MSPACQQHGAAAQRASRPQVDGDRDPLGKILTAQDTISLAVEFSESILRLIVDHGNGADQKEFSTSHDAILSCLNLVLIQMTYARDAVIEIDDARIALKKGG